VHKAIALAPYRTILRNFQIHSIIIVISAVQLHIIPLIRPAIITMITLINDETRNSAADGLNKEMIVIGREHIEEVPNNAKDIDENE
jgi:hypothetical protein